MQPPKSAVGSLTIGLGALAAGIFAGAYIGSRVLPVGKRFGAMQGGYIGAIATSTGAVIVGFVDPDWSGPAAVTSLTGLTAFLIANLASVVTTNKQFAELDTIMPGLTAAAAGEEPVLPQAAPTPQSSIVTLGTDNNNQSVSVHVGDTIVLTLPVSAGFGWFYAPQTGAALTYGSRSSAPSVVTDTWSAVAAGTYKLDVQNLPVDSNGTAISNIISSELVYNITVS